MLQEQNFDFISWWNEQSFPGKELYRMSADGELVLQAGNNIKERSIAKITPENADAVIKQLVEKFAALHAKVTELEVEWVAAEDKQKLADKVALVKEYLNHTDAVGDIVSLASLVQNWEQTLHALAEENYADKLKIAEMAESLVDSGQWKETTLAFRDITDKWKAAGHLDKNRNDKLWNRIEAARKAFLDRKHIHHEEQEKDMLRNMDLKIDLVEQAESIASSEEWKNTSETFHRLTEEWKTIGHTINKKNEELWQRFIAAKAAFFDRKKEHAQKIQVEQQKNFEAKELLVDKAEALKDSKEWNTTTQAFAALMEEWKKTGRIPQEKGDGLWKRFSAAQEQFFEAKRTHFGEIKAVHDQNYTLKKALLDRAEELKNSTKWGPATGEMQQLIEDWKKIGPVARSHSDKMWEEFNAARKYFFARKDANREQQKQYVEQQKEVRAAQAKGLIVKLQADIKEEEEKLADFHQAIQDITPGKKAAELRAHLETLIAGSEVTLNRLRDKFAQAEKDINATQHQNKNPANAE